MDGELVSNSLSKEETTDEGSERDNRSAPLCPYTEVFCKKFPYYLSIGMTEKQYWDGDCCLVKYYREAEEIRKERVNNEAWLQGMYVYDAIARLSPILRAFSKKGTKAQPYVEEAYPISRKTANNAKVKKEQKQMQKGQMYMQAFMVANNTRFEERK